MSCILLTGGLGYIGSHTLTILSETNQDFVVVDNCSNCKSDVISRLEILLNKKLNF